MLQNISKLNNVGKFSSIKQEKNFIYGEKGQNCNIIFGFNGSGKTTLSNTISFFADNLFISEEEKKEIFDDIKNGDNSQVELLLQNNSNIKYPANHAHSKNFYIFNSNFVASHVYNGTKGRLKKFSNIGGEIKNKEIGILNQQIDILNEEKKKLEDENKKLDDKHEGITKTKSKNFAKTLTDKNKRLITQNLLDIQLSKSPIEDLEIRLSSLTADYELSKKQEDLSTDLGELRQLSFDNFSFDFNKIDEILSKNVQQLSKEALERKILEIQNLFSDEPHKQSSERWLKYGKDILEKIKEHNGKNCPICNTDISTKLNFLLQDYQGYFDESYENFIAELKTNTDKISMIIVSLNQYEKNVEKLNKLFTKYERLLTDLLLENYDFTAVKNDLLKLDKSLKTKNDNIQSFLTKSSTINENFSKLNIAITNFHKLKTSMLSILESMKLNTHVLEGNIRQTYNEIIISEFNNSYKVHALEKYKNNNIRISVINESESEGLPFLKNKLRIELKTLKTESKSISIYLFKMGIDHFEIDMNESEQDENIIIKYKNASSDKNKLRNCLSDGEKTALAFAYFLSKFENEINTPEKVKDSVVVIDDPISSLDDNRLYSTAHMIWCNFYEVKQLIVLSHNFLFLKFFNSFYYGKSNCLFLEGEKITELPDELKNFETPYFYMLKTIDDFMDHNNQKVTYNEAKRYLPNFIRRVLETFLSFKFSRTVNRAGGYRSPGLTDFDKNIEDMNVEIEIRKKLIEKISEINRIADIHSHGNAHHTQENFYISETELKNLSHNTLEIIEIMDNLHYRSITPT